MGREVCRNASLPGFVPTSTRALNVYRANRPVNTQRKGTIETLGERGHWTLFTLIPHQAGVEKLNRVLVNELSEVEKKYKKGKDWYSSLDNGPSNIRELARHLHKMGHYLLLYRHWSSTIHASDASHFLTERDGRLAFRPREQPELIAHYGHAATMFMKMATSSMTRKFIPG